MPESNARAAQFFQIYEKANKEFDVAKLADLYADGFVFAGPQGAQAVKKADFVQVLPKRKEFFRSVGLVSSSVKSIEVSELDSRYTSVKATWRMRFQRAAGDPIEIDTFSTYILFADADTLRIVFQLDHQDLMKKVQELGLK